MLALLLLAAAPIAAHGLGPAELDAWLKKLDRDRSILLSLDVHSVAGRPVFCARAGDNAAKRAWEVSPALTPAAFNDLFDKRFKDGYRLTVLQPYSTRAGVRFAAAWVKDTSIAHLVRLGLSDDDYQKFFKKQVKAGFRPASICGYLDGKDVRYAVIFEQRGGIWASHHGLDEKEHERLLADYARKGYRPVHVSPFFDGKQPRFNVVVEKDGLEGVYRSGLTAAAFAKLAAEQEKAGLTLAGVAGYATPKESRYLGYWVRPKKELVLPTTGKAVPELAAFDKAMLAYMKERDIESGTLAVRRGGKLVLSRGYGWLDRDHKKPIPPDVPFRLASVTKSFTAALVYDLVTRGKLKLSDKAFDRIGIDLPPGKESDPRLKAITVQMLLEHRGGWDSEAKFGDPMAQDDRVRKALGLKGPPTSRDVIRYMNGRKLDFDPDSKRIYSNYGFCVLGRVIEKASGETYAAAVKRLLEPHGIKSVAPGRTRIEDRNPAEPFYSDPGMWPDVMRGSGLVSAPDGGFNLEAMDANGGLIGSAPDVAKFCGIYWLSGQRRKEGALDLTAFGSLPGTWAMARQRPDGVDVVALFNQRFAPDGLKPEAIEKLLDEAADSIKVWP
jgi:CubicO group peptidase (beta-lactamase class C family)